MARARAGCAAMGCGSGAAVWATGVRAMGGKAGGVRALGVRVGAVGRAPACQSRRSCSNWSKMRAKAAAIRACRRAGSHPRAAAPRAALRRRAMVSPRGEAQGSIGGILTNLTPARKEKIKDQGIF